MIIHLFPLPILGLLPLLRTYPQIFLIAYSKQPPYLQDPFPFPLRKASRFSLPPPSPFFLRGSATLSSLPLFLFSLTSCPSSSSPSLQSLPFPFPSPEPLLFSLPLSTAPPLSSSSLHSPFRLSFLSLQPLHSHLPPTLQLPLLSPSPASPLPPLRRSLPPPPRKGAFSLPLAPQHKGRLAPFDISFLHVILLFGFLRGISLYAG